MHIGLFGEMYPFHGSYWILNDMVVYKLLNPENKILSMKPFQVKWRFHSTKEYLGVTIEASSTIYFLDISSGAKML